MQQNVLVYGIGAIGSQIGGRLSENGRAVTLVEPWDVQQIAVASRGIVIKTDRADEHYTPPVIRPDDLDSFGNFDIVFLCVKSFDTVAAIDRILPHLKESSIVVSMQNGINEEYLVPVLGEDRVVGGVILINAVLSEPGVTIVTQSVSRAAATGSLPGVYVGEFGRHAGEKANRVAAILSNVWPAETVDDLLYHRWSKLVNNTMVNTVCGISGMGSAAVLGDARARKLLIGLGSEVILVARESGHHLQYIMGDYAAESFLAAASGDSNELDEALSARAKRVSDDATPSLLQDVRRGRQTEVDYFSGLVTTRGEDFGIRTPFCAACTDLLHQIERGSLSPSSDNLNRVLQMVSVKGN